MDGKLVVLKVDGTREETPLATASGILDKLQAAVGGYIETVPYFTTWEGQTCAAFCNEEGKLTGLPMNIQATALWRQQVLADDVLVGDVAIVTGSASFMREL